MFYVPFHDYFPKIAEKETRTAFVLNDPDLPSGDYSFIDTYCDDPDCDCRRVIFYVISSATRKPMAVIAYGWEDKRFYAKWFGDNDPEMLNDLKGPALNVGSPQSKYAPALLKLVKELIQDKAYVERLKNHYALFKAHIKKTKGVKSPARSANIIGRNDPCPCGSGKKYKKCCLGKLRA